LLKQGTEIAYVHFHKKVKEKYTGGIVSEYIKCQVVTYPEYILCDSRYIVVKSGLYTEKADESDALLNFLIFKDNVMVAAYSTWTKSRSCMAL
jgi:hypothetical protein